MELRESDRIEFKLEVNERICKTVVAFANTLGGTIYVGIDVSAIQSASPPKISTARCSGSAISSMISSVPRSCSSYQ